MSVWTQRPGFRDWAAGAAVLLLTGTAQAVEVPDPAVTPGEALPVTSVDVCSPGYQPDTTEPSVPKLLNLYEAYGLAYFHDGYCNNLDGCQLDHLISLNLGGANTLGNLWPQPVTGEWNAAKKDRLEQRLHQMVCNGELTITEAQLALTSDWRVAYRQYVATLPGWQVVDPKRQEVDGVAILSGGVGEAARAVMNAEAPGYSLRLGFALANGGNFVSQVRVRIQDMAGRPVAHATTAGPWFFARLAPGRYTVTAEHGGQSQTYTADLTQGQAGLHYLFWNS